MRFVFPDEICFLRYKVVFPDKICFPRYRLQTFGCISCAGKEKFCCSICISEHTISPCGTGHHFQISKRQHICFFLSRNGLEIVGYLLAPVDGLEIVGSTAVSDGDTGLTVSHCPLLRSAFYWEGTISKGTFWLDRFWEVAVPTWATLKQNCDPRSARVGPFEAKQCRRRPLWSRTIRECHSSFQMFRCAHNVQRKKHDIYVLAISIHSTKIFLQPLIC